MNDFTLINEHLFFIANDGTSGGELWTVNVDGTGLTQVADINPGSGGSYSQTKPVSVDGRLFFVANDGTSGWELWSVNDDGTGVPQLNDIFPGSDSSVPIELTPFDGRLFFAANDGINGHALWAIDGDGTGLTQVEDVNPGIGFSNVSRLTNINGQLFFSANDGTSGQELWRFGAPNNLDGLEAAVNLAVVSIQSANLPNLLALGGPKYLQELNLPDAFVSDWSALANLYSLLRLDLSGSNFDDPTNLPSNAPLRELDLSDTSVSVSTLMNDLGTLFGSLKRLDAADLGLSSSDLVGIDSLTNLEVLNLQNNQLDLIDSLLSLPAIQEVDLTGNPLDANAHLVVIPALIARGVNVIYDNPISFEFQRDDFLVNPRYGTINELVVIDVEFPLDPTANIHWSVSSLGFGDFTGSGVVAFSVGDLQTRTISIEVDSTTYGTFTLVRHLDFLPIPAIELDVSSIGVEESNGSTVRIRLNLRS